MFKSVIALAVIFSVQVQADTFLTDMPSNSISVKEASKLESFYRCSKVKQGPNINPVKVKGSASLFFKEVKQGLDDVGELLSDGKTLIKCENVEINKENGRVRKI